MANLSSRSIGRKVAIKNVVRNGLTTFKNDPRYNGTVSGGTDQTVIISWNDGLSSEITNDVFNATIYFISEANK